MGDRAIVVLVGRACLGAPRGPYFAALYLHSGGYEGTMEALQKAAPNMRARDPSYALARLAGAATALKPDSALSIGIIEGPPALDDETLEAYSQGDAGVCVVDMDTGAYRWAAGYVAYSQEGDMQPTGTLPLYGLPHAGD